MTWIRRLLAEQMPSAFVAIEQWPLTTNGKVDKKALPAPESTQLAQDYVAPCNDTEQKLVGLWAKSLDVSAENLSTDTNFFELGGHSLLVNQLISEINLALGCQMRLQDLFGHQNIGTMAQFIAEQQQNQQSVTAHLLNETVGLLELKPGDPQHQPLFFVHPVGGSGFCYAELANALANALAYPGAIYALQALDDGPQSIKTIAAEYVERIKACQGDGEGDGDYLLAGWSMGGVIAYEMAQQLLGEGCLVGHLWLIDSFNPAFHCAGDELNDDGEQDDQHKEWVDKQLLQTLAAELAVDIHAKGQYSNQYLLEQPLVVLLELLLEQGKEQRRLPPDYSLKALRARFDLLVKNNRALQRYRPVPLDTQVSLIRGTDPGNDHQSLGWSALVPKISHSVIQGDHFSIMRHPHVIHMSVIWLTP
jgi:thioesterase domain-containing protein/acyl carrier protein